MRWSSRVAAAFVLLLVIVLSGCSLRGHRAPAPTQASPNVSANATANLSANASNATARVNASNVSNIVVVNESRIPRNATENATVSPEAKLNDSTLGLVYSTDPSPRIVSFSLMSAAANTVIPGYANVTGTVKIERDMLPRDLSVRANYAGDVSSVLFALNGDPFHRVENLPPFALNGDNAGNYKAWDPSTGTYTIIATPYTRQDATGTAGPNATVVFEFYAKGYLQGTQAATNSS